MAKKLKQTTANEALEKLEKDKPSINDINSAILNKNVAGIVDFMMRFSVSKDCQQLFQVLAKISEQPQTFNRGSDFDTLYAVAMLDGERNLVRKFAQLVTSAMEGDRLTLEKHLNSNGYL